MSIGLTTVDGLVFLGGGNFGGGIGGGGWFESVACCGVVVFASRAKGECCACACFGCCCCCGGDLFGLGLEGVENRPRVSMRERMEGSGMLTWPGGGGINVGGGVNVVVVGSGAEVKRLDGMDGLATAAPLLKKRRKTRRYMINTVTWIRMQSLLIDRFIQGAVAEIRKTRTVNNFNSAITWQ